MNLKKVLALILGILCGIIVSCGICMLVCPENAAIIIGITVICLSLAVGLIVPIIFPIALFGLVTGICMLFVSGKILGIIFLVFGIMGAIGALILYKIGNKK